MRISRFPIGPNPRPSFGSRILRLFIGPYKSLESKTSSLHTVFHGNTPRGGRDTVVDGPLNFAPFHGEICIVDLPPCFASFTFERTRLPRIALINRQKDVVTGEIQGGERVVR